MDEEKELGEGGDGLKPQIPMGVEVICEGNDTGKRAIMIQIDFIDSIRFKLILKLLPFLTSH